MQHIIEFRCSACLAIHWFDAILGNSEKNQPCLRSDQDSFRSTKPTMLLMIRESLVGWLIYPVEIRYCANLSHDATDENQKKLAGMKIPLMTYNPTCWQKKTQEKPRKVHDHFAPFCIIYFFRKNPRGKDFHVSVSLEDCQGFRDSGNDWACARDRGKDRSGSKAVEQWWSDGSPHWKNSHENFGPIRVGLGW